jgi:hypothetical protein
LAGRAAAVIDMDIATIGGATDKAIRVTDTLDWLLAVGKLVLSRPERTKADPRNPLFWRTVAYVVLWC